MRKAETASFCKGQNQETVERLRFEYANGNTETHSMAVPALAERRRGRKAESRRGDGQLDDRETDGKKAAVGRCRRLLKSIATVAANSQVDPNVRRPRCLALAANVLALIAQLEERQPYRNELRRWAACHVPGVRESELEAAEHGSIVPNRPDPRAAGRALMLTRSEWLSLNRPWGLWPIDLSETDIKRQQRRESDAIEKARKRMDRMNEGATPQSESIAALARRHGKSRTTIYAWLRSGKLKLNSFGVTLYIEDSNSQTSAESVQSKRARRKPSARASSPQTELQSTQFRNFEGEPGGWLTPPPVAVNGRR